MAGTPQTDIDGEALPSDLPALLGDETDLPDGYDNEAARLENSLRYSPGSMAVRWLSALSLTVRPRQPFQTRT